MPYAPGKSPNPARTRQGGFALVLMLVLLIAGSLYALVSHLEKSELRASEGAATAAALTKARDALLGYAATYRESHAGEGFGPFPCPDTHDGSNPGLIGTADGSCGSAGVMAIGLLPYKTLGLSDLRDSSGECLWYAVAGNFKNNPKTDPLNWDTQGDITIKDASGVNTLGALNDANGGIAVIVFAPGAALNGQGDGRNALATPCRSNPTQVSHYLEYTSSPFRQGPGLDTGGATVLNDQLIWLSSADVFNRIRSRSDFANYVNAGIKGIRRSLSFSLPSPATDPNNGDAAALLPETAPATLSIADQRFYQQWRDQFVYRKCGGGPCYSLGGQQCEGVLLFSGEKINAGKGQPRPTTDRSFTSYFESNLIAAANALAIADGSSNTMNKVVTLYATDTPAARAQDLALCLSPVSQSLDTGVAGRIPVNVYSPSDVGPIVDYNNNPSLANPAIRLGQTGVSDTAYGCLWFPEPLQLGASDAPVYLRAYFQFSVETRGHGFTLTLADADSSINPTASMCGKGSAYLGYAGDNSSHASINFPKLALEIDTNKDASFGDADASHLALVYWGADNGKNDDNTHGSGNNPAASSTAYKAYPIAVGTTYHVRLEMKRTYQSSLDIASHELRAYITTTPCTEFSDLSADLSSFFASPGSPCVPTPISSTIQLLRSEGGPAPMKQIWVGFTSGQDQDQLVRIPRFSMQVSQR
jgi:hypothetical protein